MLLAYAVLGALLSVAAASAQGNAAPTVAGVATDGAGRPLAGVTVTIVGPTKRTTSTNDGGAYTFANVEPGVYTITAQKGGYTTATQAATAVVAGEPLTANVTLTQASLTTISNLREIGRVSTGSGANVAQSKFNPSPASVDILTQSTFLDQGQQQVQRILEQTPGVTIDHPGTSATDASPGAITFPSIRGALGFETASLIDGHPLAVQTFGDYVTTFLNANVLQGVEVVKGPGATPNEVNYAIGGTVNFRTLDPPAKPTASVTEGYDSFGGQFSNYNFGGTVGKFGWVLDYAVDGTPGPLDNALQPTTLSSNSDFLNCASPTPTTSCTAPGALTTTVTPPHSQFGISFGDANVLACCFPISQTFNDKTELVKARYAFSPSTSATISYLGSQTWTDQNGNHVDSFATNFTPGALYTGSVAAGPESVWENVFFPSTEWEINNEPIFQGELRTTLGNDTLLARYYTASINRLQYNGLQFGSEPFTTDLALFGAACNTGFALNAAGTLCTKAGSPSVAPSVFNGQTMPVTITNQYFRETEEDKLHGSSFEYDHPLGNQGNLISAGYEGTSTVSDSYEFSGTSESVSIPAGSSQGVQTAFLREVFNPLPKFTLIESTYFETYHNVFSSDNGATFQTADSTHLDGRLGLAYRVDADTSVRFGAGSAIAPPYLDLLDFTTSAPVAAPGGLFATQNVASGNLKPETSFSYDIGFDKRLSNDRATNFTMDVYTTNIQNQFQELTNLNGTAVVGGATLPLIATSFVNIARVRDEGLEFGITRTPVVGLGFVAQGALIRAYPYGLNNCFYGETITNGVVNCNVFTSNLAIINGENYQEGIPSGGRLTTNNHAIPYSSGYLELSYNFPHGNRIEFGATYYGPNNSYALPAFTIENFNAIINAGNYLPLLGDTTKLQFSVDNVTNAFSNGFATSFAGVPDPLVNGNLGLTNANTIGPRTFRFFLTSKVGAR